MMVSPIVETKQGKIRGKLAKDYNGRSYSSFQGVPYAKPPIGDLRFKAPVPHSSWTGIRDAVEEPSESLSRNFFQRNELVGSEDCLYLNVFTPETSTKSLNPVMVWIHGGGFTMGSSRTEMYGPDYLLTENVVIVTINYRLGILGFLSLDDSSLGVPGNAALKDMVQSLKWVQENIRNFGGDPKNVTIFGESAGAAACHFLVLSPMAKGLFHRAILQSGCVFNPWVNGSRNAKEIAEALDYNSNNDKDILAFLRSVTSEQIFKAQEKIKDTLGCDEPRPFGPVIEKISDEPAFISEDPALIIASGNYNKVPIMIGYTSREGMITEIADTRTHGLLQVLNDFETRIPHYYNIPKGSELAKTVAKKIQDFYYGPSTPAIENIDHFLKLETDVLFWRGIFVTMRQHLATMNLPIYLYKLTADTNLNLIKKVANLTRPGVCHCDDIGYLFKTTMLSDIEPGSLEEVLMFKMVKLWTNFAKTGNPNVIEEVIWKPIEKQTYNYLNIGRYLSTGSNPDFDRMKFWDDISAHTSINSKL